MASSGPAARISRLSIQLSAVFALVGIALLYLYIIASEAPETVKILWSSGLSIGVAFSFLIMWTIARDAVRESEREARRRTMP